MTRLTFRLLILLALGFPGYAHAAEKFERAAVRIDQSVTDEDIEVVFEATSGDIGLATLRVTAPGGRTVIDFKAPDSKLGMRAFVLESPEPKKKDGSLQKDFPAGEYTFTGTTVAGGKLSGKATLSHTLPGPASIVQPRAKEDNVTVKGLQISWTAPKNLDSCIVIVEHEQSKVKVFQAAVSGATTTVAVPDGLLVSGAKYKVEIGTVARDGNRSFVESSFSTGKK